MWDDTAGFDVGETFVGLELKKDVYYSEVTREKVYDRTHKEIPYECKITTDKISNSKNTVTNVTLIK